MPRLTIHLSAAQHAELTALHVALERRRRESQGDVTHPSIEATAAVALEYGLQALRKVWVASEFGVPVRNSATLDEHVGAQPCLHCGRPTSLQRVGDLEPECMRADCPRPVEVPA